MLLSCLVLILMSAGCGDRHAVLHDLAGPAGWQNRTFQAEGFAITGYFRPGPAGRDGLAVYIEGDGRGWATPRQISSDPTPGDPTAFRMAMHHPAGPVLYLARPCQYAPQDIGTRCDFRYWTTHRYAPDTVAALGAAVEAMVRRTGADAVTLVGYSGGGVIAALLAASRRDVRLLVTVASPLDLAFWTRQRKLTPLDGSLNPADEVASLAGIPQYHFAGGRDEVVPPAVPKAFAAQFPAGRRPAVRVVEGFNHHCCWADRWAGLVAEATGR